MYFASDNAGPAHPAIMQAVADANTGYALPYGADTIMDDVRAQIRDTFEAPNAAVYLVATGTAANSLGLSCVCQPFETIFCSPVAHIHEDECNAPEFFTGGAKLTLVPGGDRMTPERLRTAIEGEENRGVHGPQRGAVSITNVAEIGNVYTLAEMKALCDIAKGFDMPVHLDGARFAQACAALDCSPAEMSWKLGIDVAVFGGTKNGLMGVEAVVIFDPKLAYQFELRRKRGAHLFSKHRYLSAQMQSYLADDLWQKNASQANANCARLVAGLRDTETVSFMHEPQANMIFCSFPRAAHQRLHDAGAMYYVWSGTLEGDDPNEMLEARLVCDWSISDALIDQFVDLVRGNTP